MNHASGFSLADPQPWFPQGRRQCHSTAGALGGPSAAIRATTGNGITREGAMPNQTDEYPDRNAALRAFIHEQMRRRGWNYTEFGKAVGTDGSVVSRWIRDRRPSPAMVRQMAERLGVDE